MQAGTEGFVDSVGNGTHFLRITDNVHIRLRRAVTQGISLCKLSCQAAGQKHAVTGKGFTGTVGKVFDNNALIRDFFELCAVVDGDAGSLKPVANLTYIITPYNVGFIGEDLVNELETNGVIM